MECWALRESYKGYFSIVKLFWSVKAPQKVAFFSSTALDRILTVDNLRKHYLVIIDWCCMCKNSRESVDHLLLHCMVAEDIWFIFSLFGFSWIMPMTVAKVLLVRREISLSQKLWSLECSMTVSCGWFGVNKRSFDYVEHPNDKSNNDY